MEDKVISQKEYLKKYLSGSTADTKRKKKKLKVGPKTVKIIDDDIDLKNMRPIEEGEFDILLNSEDAPQIAGIIDERGPIDFTDRNRWKIITDDNEGDITFASNRRDEMKQNRSNDIDLKHNLVKQKQKKKHSKVRKDSENEDLSPARKQSKQSDDDLSPPRMCNPTMPIEKRRKQIIHSEDELNSETVKRKKVKKKRSLPKSDDSDQSPPRQNKNREHSNARSVDSDQSPPRREKRYKRNQGRSEDSDQSPPRRDKNYESTRTKVDDFDECPPKRKKYYERSKTKSGDSDQSPPRQDKNYGSSRPKIDDFDQSPPRRKKGHGHSKAKSDDYDLPRQKKSYEHTRTKSNYSDQSPPRQERNYDSDLSPPRHRKSELEDHRLNQREQFSDKSESRSRERRYERGKTPPMKSRDKYGDASSNSRTDKRRDKSEQHKYHSHRKTSEKKSDHRRYDGRPDSKSSERKHRSSRWGNETKNRESEDTEATRDTGTRMKKTLDGKTAGLQDARALREETEAHKKREAEQFSKLSKEITGVGQAAIMRDSRTGRKRNLEAEAAEERAKQERQAELDEQYAKWGRGLKQVEDRQEKLKNDLYEMSKPLARYADDADLDKELKQQERDGDPMLEYIKQKQIKEGKREPDRPKYEGSFMPNRFGIKPGHRWDGVDRSNGYEKKWFDAQNAKKAVQEEAYKWSTADM